VPDQTCEFFHVLLKKFLSPLKRFGLSASVTECKFRPCMTHRTCFLNHMIQQGGILARFCTSVERSSPVIGCKLRAGARRSMDSQMSYWISGNRTRIIGIDTQSKLP
jgi:hypothetical protein